MLTFVIIWFAVAILVSLAIGRVFAVSHRHVALTSNSVASSHVAQRRQGTAVHPLDTAVVPLVVARRGRRKASGWPTAFPMTAGKRDGVTAPH